MRLGVISDVHANIVALQTVLDDMPSVTQIAHAGDVIGYNPWPKETIELFRDEHIQTILGNHDRVLLEEDDLSDVELHTMTVEGLRHADRQLQPSHRRWLQSQPVAMSLFDGQVKVVHGHPDDPDKYTFPRSFSPALFQDGEDLLVMGHTHIQHSVDHRKHVADEDETEVGWALNPGSVGQPRDKDPRAAYAVVELDETGVTSVDCRRVEYDVEKVIQKIDDVGLPAETGERLRHGRLPTDR